MTTTATVTPRTTTLRSAARRLSTSAAATIAAVGLAAWTSSPKAERHGRVRQVLLARTLSILTAVLITIPLLNLGAHAAVFPSLIGHRGVGDPWTAQLGIP